MSRRVHEQLRDLRVARRMTQEELAETIGRSQGAISQFEVGYRPINAWHLEKAAEALGVRVELVEAERELPVELSHFIELLVRAYPKMNKRERRMMRLELESYDEEP